jgi:hypothetical protein
VAPVDWRCAVGEMSFEVESPALAAAIEPRLAVLLLRTTNVGNFVDFDGCYLADRTRPPYAEYWPTAGDLGLGCECPPLICSG